MLPDFAFAEVCAIKFKEPTDPADPAEPVFKSNWPGVVESEDPVVTSIEPEAVISPLVPPLTNKILPPVVVSLRPAVIATEPVVCTEVAVEIMASPDWTFAVPTRRLIAPEFSAGPLLIVMIPLDACVFPPVCISKTPLPVFREPPDVIDMEPPVVSWEVPAPTDISDDFVEPVDAPPTTLKFVVIPSIDFPIDNSIEPLFD